MDKFDLFFYIGIFLFITHMFLHGISVDISFFGLFLIVVGWRKIEIWSWVRFFMWIFIVIEISATIFSLQRWVDNFLNPSESTSTIEKKKKLVKEQEEEEQEKEEQEKEEEEQEEEEQEEEEEEEEQEEEK